MSAAEQQDNMNVTVNEDIVKATPNNVDQNDNVDDNDTVVNENDNADETNGNADTTRADHDDNGDAALSNNDNDDNNKSNDDNNENKAELSKDNTNSNSSKKEDYVVVNIDANNRQDDHDDDHDGALDKDQAKDQEKEDSRPLPQGWRKGTNEAGRVFYIDDINHKTQWDDPRPGLSNSDDNGDGNKSVDVIYGDGDGDGMGAGAGSDGFKSNSDVDSDAIVYAPATGQTDTQDETVDLEAKGDKTVTQTKMNAVQQDTVTHEVRTDITDLVNDSEKDKNPTKDGASDGDDTDNINGKTNCIDKSGNYIFYALLTSLLIMLGISIGINGANGTLSDFGDELGAIIGLTAFNMVLTPALLCTVGFYFFIRSITECSALFILFITLFLLLFNFVYFAIYLPDYAFFYGLYIFIKIMLLIHFYKFGKIDVKHFGSNVIQEFLHKKDFLFYQSKIIYIWPWVALILFIQMVLFILGCLAFVGPGTGSMAVRIITFFLLLWTIKSFTYALHWIYVRVFTYQIDEKSRYGIKTNDSTTFQRVHTMSRRLLSISQRKSNNNNTEADGTGNDNGNDNKETNGSTVTVNAATVKTQTVEIEEVGTTGKISATSKVAAASTLEAEVKVDGGNGVDAAIDTDAIHAAAGAQDGSAADDTGVVSAKKDEQVMNSEEIKTEFDLESKNDENFDGISNAMNEASTKVATIIIGSLLVSVSGIPNVIANFATAAKITGLILTACCITEDARGNVRTRGNCGCVFATLGSIFAGIAWVLEKISKFLLQYCHKMILTSSAFRNITFCQALKKQRAMVKETKSNHGSKMVLLDNALAQHMTHLNLLCSCLGAWICIWVGYPEYAPLIHIAGYIAGRTAFELIDVLLQLWLVIFHLDPVLLGNNEVVYEIVIKRVIEMEYELNGEKRTRQEIEFEIQGQVRTHKLVDSDGNFIEEKAQDVMHVNQTHVITMETNDATQLQISNGNPASNTATGNNAAIGMSPAAITYGAPASNVPIR